jgi:hypothetical protein
VAEWWDEFIESREPLGWSAPEGTPRSLTPHCVFIGPGPNALEVAVASAGARPKAEDVRKLWTLRQAKRPSPVLVVIGYDDGGHMKAAVCGPVGEHPPFVSGLDLSQVERLADAALAEPTRHAAIRFLVAMIPEAESDLPGLRNAGLLAAQELRNGVPRRHDWDAACVAGKHMLGLSGRGLIERLGFKVDSLSVRSNVLTIAGGSKRAVAVFLEEGETFEEVSEGFNGTTAVSHALAVADNENLPWVVLTRGREIRLYAARPDTGVGRKGRSETFVEVNLALLPDQAAGYVPLLFGSDALREGGTVEQILGDSEIFAADLASRLRQRVYFEAVPALATAIARRMGDPYDLTDEDLGFAYEQTLVVLFRLLFVAYGEDRDLLPYRTNSKYQTHSLKQIARHLADDRVKGTVEFEAHTEDHWEDVTQLWRGVDKGNRAWGLPAYNGGLFSSDPAVNRAGAALADIRLSDAEFGPALSSLLVDVGQDDVIGPVDFRSLSVREFGTIYEGLLESMLSIAQTDLTLDAKDNYVPATASDTVEVHQGEVYFHNRSGERKATGSYFTKPFAVEHLLDNALEPALDAHLVRVKEHLDGGDDAKAAEAFFDFRCVDLAMGSGHFLVAAVDRIEARLANFLALNPIPAVNKELALLREAAREHLGDLADGMEIETTSLLRRQVARRCVYGVDRNRIAVELARLAIWIHTFVPGLPLSFLDHSLRQGDSLTGIGTLDEALDMLDPQASKTGNVSLFRGPIEDFLARSATALRRLATITERTAADIAEARQAHADALAAVEPARQLFDVLIAARLGEAAVPTTLDEGSIGRDPALERATELVTNLRSLHFPIAFPEVFLRDNPGFDCLLGNPPWEEATVEELGFFVVRQPGLKALSPKDQKQAIAAIRATRRDLVKEYEAALAEAETARHLLLAGPFPGMGQGDPDLYKAFTWRFWSLLRLDGFIGIVLPRSALTASGSAEWRRRVLSDGEFVDVTVLHNAGYWVFDDMDNRKAVGLLAIHKGGAEPRRVWLRGPYSSRAAYETGLLAGPLEFAAQDFGSWSDGASFPLIPSDRAGAVFRVLRGHPRLEDVTNWRCRPVTELHATSDKKHMELDADSQASLWPVYGGRSFEIWTPDRGSAQYFAWGDPKHLVPLLQDRRRRSFRRAGSPLAGMGIETIGDETTLPCLGPRIAFRDIANRTNQRTVIASLVPPKVFLTNKAPYLIWPNGDEHDQAYLLGVLSSMPLDWYARRVVEINLNFHLFRALPIPDAPRSDPLRKRVEHVAARLACVDDRFGDWASVLRAEVGTVADEDRADLIAELDAAVALLYGLSRPDLRVIYDTFHEGADYSEHEARVLEHYGRLS